MHGVPLQHVLALGRGARAGLRFDRTGRRAGSGGRRDHDGASDAGPHQRHPVDAGRRGERQQELAAFERQLRPDPVLHGQADQRQERRPAEAGLRLSDRGAGIDGDRADRRQRRHVPDDVVQSRVRDRRQDRRRVLALQAQARSDRDRLLRQQQPRRRDRRRQAVHGHDRREAGRARRQDRQAAVGDADRRSGQGLFGDDGAGVRRRQDPDRHQRRRIRHPRLRQGVRRQGRQAAVDVLHDPGQGPRRRLGDEGRRPAATCIATSTPKRPRSPRTARSISSSAAACG